MSTRWNKISSLGLALGLWFLGESLSAQPVRPAPNHGPLDRILRETVRNERVDYLLIRRDHQQALTEYLDQMAEIPWASLSKPDALAYLFNVYNATLITAIAERFVDGYRTDAHGFAVFDEPLVRLEGKRVSLNHLEHEILRKRYAEPRLHAALVCGARSCPPLIARAYRGDDLDALLEDRMRDFIRDPRRNRVDHDAKKLRISKIFEWYGDDFGGPSGIKATFSRTLDRNIESYDLEFLPYSWKLNIATPIEGRWVVIRSSPPGSGEKAPLEPGEVVEVLEESEGRLRVSHPSGDESWIDEGAAEAFRVPEQD